MRLFYIMAGLFVLLLSFFVSYAYGAAAANTSTINPGGPPRFSINQSINSTVAYIANVSNQSYFVFYPNLQQANLYLQEAINVSSKNTTEAYLLLGKARQSAAVQQDSLKRSKFIAFSVLVVLTMISALSLFVITRPKNKGSRKAGR